MDRLKLVPYGVVIAVVILWASASVAGKWLGTDMQASDISVWRTIFGILTVAVFAKWDIREPIRGMRLGKQALAHYAPLWLIGICGYGLMQWLFFLSAQRTLAGHLVLIMSLTPLFVRFFRWVWYKEPMRLSVWLGSFLAISGSTIILLPGRFSTITVVGDLLGIGAMLAFTVYTEGMNAFGQKLPSASVNLHVMGAGLVLLLIAAWWPHGAQDGVTFSLALPGSIGEAGVLLYLGVFTTGLAYLGFTWSIRRLSAAIVTPFLYLQPIFGVALAWLLLGEPVTWRFLTGIILILAGLHYVQRP